MRSDTPFCSHSRVCEQFALYAAIADTRDNARDRDPITTCRRRRPAAESDSPAEFDLWAVSGGGSDLQWMAIFAV